LTKQKYPDRIPDAAFTTLGTDQVSSGLEVADRLQSAFRMELDERSIYFQANCRLLGRSAWPLQSVMPDFFRTPVPLFKVGRFPF
jgi:hypothetical protein